MIAAVLPIRVLYVEDNPLVREITCDLIADDVREVVAVSSGEEALEVFRVGRFDVVVTDLSLPAMSGLDVMRRIKEISPALPVILASGYPLSAADLGFGATVGSITKPFESAELRALLEDLCLRAPR